jgi:hypothetical protein
MENLRRLEAKKSELEKAEEKLLLEATRRTSRNGTASPSDNPEMPPPLPPGPPPDATPSGAQRLDALIGAPKITNGVHPTAAKKVSFVTAPNVDSWGVDVGDVNDDDDEEETLSRLEQYDHAENQDPNVSVRKCPKMMGYFNTFFFLTTTKMYTKLASIGVYFSQYNL